MENLEEHCIIHFSLKLKQFVNISESVIRSSLESLTKQVKQDVLHESKFFIVQIKVYVDRRM